VKTDERGWIPVNEYCKTNVPNIYAIGDIGGKIWLAHLASAMGFCAVDNICGERNEFSYDLVPGCIFTSPEIGTVGLSEEQCKEQGIDYTVGKFPFAALGKAMAIEETDGIGILFFFRAIKIPDIMVAQNRPAETFFHDSGPRSIRPKRSKFSPPLIFSAHIQGRSATK